MNRTYYTPQSYAPAGIEVSEYRSMWCCLEKGYTPPPFQITSLTGEGKVEIVFEPNPFSATCRCQIVCTTSALMFDELEEEVGSFCPADRQYRMKLSDIAFFEDQPTSLVFTFLDSRGNTSVVQVTSLIRVIPQTPLGFSKSVDEGRRYVHQVAVPLSTSAFYDLRPSVEQYQIERYVRNPSNRAVWADWTRVPRGTRNNFQLAQERIHWDRDVVPGVPHGYRVRFRSTFDHASQWSSWLVLQS